MANDLSTTIRNLGNKLMSWLNKLGVQVALINIGLFLVIFTVIVAITLNRGQQVFTTVLNSGFPTTGAVVQQIDPNDLTKRWDIIQFDPSGVKRAVPLDVQFRDRFSESIISILLLAIGLGGLTALIISFVIMSPLQRLRTGIQKLRENNYKQVLDIDGPAEIEVLIQEFNQLARELQKVEELRRDLISDTSHELKTPITGLKGQLEGIKDGVLKPDKKRITDLLVQVDRLHELVESLQTYSRLRGKSLKPKLKKVALRKLVQKVASQFESQLLDKKIQLQLNINSKLTVQADEDLLNQVFNNLFENAIRYSQADTVTISADEHQIKFEDNGVGIPKEHLPYIFERFYRVEKSRNRDTGGLGLGLAIVKEIIEAHGWKVNAKSYKGAELSLKFT